MLGSFWGHPERVLDAQAREATSGFARMPDEIVQRVVQAVAHDLVTGVWEVATAIFENSMSLMLACDSSSAANSPPTPRRSPARSTTGNPDAGP
jgi:hypothetical protein